MISEMVVCSVFDESDFKLLRIRCSLMPPPPIISSCSIASGVMNVLINALF